MSYYLFLFILISYGFAAILTFGKIFDKIRPKHCFFHCIQCISFWCSGVNYTLFWLSGIKLFPNLYFGIFLFACLGSGTSYIIDSLIDDNGLRIETYLKK